MKKSIFAIIAIAMMVTFANSQAMADIKIGSIEVEVNYERGKKEWNADHTATECVGRGMCKLTVKGTAGAIGAFKGSLTNNDETIYVVIYARDAQQFSQDFEGDMYSINSDFEVPQEAASALNCSSAFTVRAGVYQVYTDAYGNKLIKVGPVR